MTVHDSLRQSHFQIVEYKFLQRDFCDVEIPMSYANMSWGGVFHGQQKNVAILSL